MQESWLTVAYLKDTRLVSSLLADLPSPSAIDPKAAVFKILFQNDLASELDAPKLLDSQVLDQNHIRLSSYLITLSRGSLFGMNQKTYLAVHGG